MIVEIVKLISYLFKHNIFLSKINVEVIFDSLESKLKTYHQSTDTFIHFKQVSQGIFEDGMGKTIENGIINLYYSDNSSAHILAISALHEYGHSINFIKKYKTINRFDLRIRNKKPIVLKEEYVAWYNGFVEIFNLPISIFSKIILLLTLPMVGIVFWSSYLIHYE